MRSGRASAAKKTAAAAAAGVAIALAGCSAVLGIDADRHLAVADAGADAQAGAWSCVSAPDETPDPDSTVDLTLLVMDALQPSVAAGAVDGGSDLDTVSGTFLSGVSVQACERLDPDCTNGSAPVVTDDAGAAEFQLAGDFAGFFEMSRSDLVPATLYPGKLLAGDPVASFPAYDITPAGFTELASAVLTSDTVSLDPDGTLGHVVVTIYDCLDHQAPGVALSYSASGPQMVPFYFKGGLPSTAATATDGYGLAGAVDVPAGTLTATATLAATGTKLGAATFVVRPGAITFAWVRVRTH